MAQGSGNFNILSNTVDIGGTAVSAFGTLETGELTPLVQLDFVYGINSQTGVTSVSGTGATVDTDSSRLRIQSGTNSAGSALFTSRSTAKYRPGQGITARFTGVFAAGTNNNTQIIGVGSSTDGYFFGYNGTAFGIMTRVSGTPTWVAQTAWNQDKCDGSGGSAFNWNKQVGNVMMIKYPYLGYGNIKFYVQSSSTGVWILCHIIQYANTVATVQVSNPNLTFYAQNLNSGNTSNLTMYCGSVGIFLSGVRSFIGSPKRAYTNQSTNVIHDVDTNMVTLKNCTTYNGATNRSLIRITAVSFGTVPSSGVTSLYVRLNATVGGSPSFATIDGTTGDQGVTITSGNSIASVDIAGTTSAAGILLFSLTGSNPVNLSFDLTPYDIFIAPTERVTFSLLTSNTSTPASVAVNWSEDI